MQQSPPLGARTRLLLQGGAVPFRISPFEGVVLLALAAAALFGGYTAYAKLTDLNATPPTPPTYIPAFRTTLTSTVSTTGSVQSTQQVTLTFGTSGKIKEFLVGLGVQVEARQALARIDDADLQQAVRSAQANLDSAQARYNAAVQGPGTADVASALQSLNSAKAQLATAQQNLTDLRAKPSATDLLKAQQGVLTSQNSLQAAQDAVTKAQSDAQAAQTAYNNAVFDQSNDFTLLGNAWTSLSSASAGCGVPTPASPTSGARVVNISTIAPSSCPSTAAASAYTQSAGGYNSAGQRYNSDIDNVAAKLTALNNANNTLNNGNLQRAIQSAQLGLQAAQQTLADTLAGAKQSDLDAAQRSIDTAQAAVDSAQAKYNALFDPPKPETILPLQASVEQARAQLETAKQNLTAATIVAPFAGQISQMNGEVGSQVSANTAVFILLNPRLIRIDANVDQSDITNLKVGQPATATFDALPGRTYEASIAAIGLTPTVQQGVVTYVVTFAVDTSRLAEGTPIPAPGMTTSLTVTTSRTENALVVPSRAVRRSGRTSTVTVKTQNGDEQRTVTTGATNGTLVQISSGLNDGEEVLVSLGSTAAASNTTNTNRNQLGGAGQFVVPGGLVPITGGGGQAGR